MMLGDLFQALREAGASEAQARQACAKVADFDRRLSRREILMAVNTAERGSLASCAGVIFQMVWNINQAVTSLGWKRRAGTPGDAVSWKGMT